MAQTHYKLPIDDEVDKDIVDWINSFPRNKKGEMVRHAIRYYMSELDEGETIKFPSSPSKRVVDKPRENSQSSQNKKERKRPSLNSDALK